MWDNVWEDDINHRREEAALTLIQKGIVSQRDWQETLEHIGEKRYGKMVPRVTPNAKPDAKGERAKVNQAWLNGELLKDEEDWQTVLEYTQKLPE
jgi:hypothetical protein